MHVSINAQYKVNTPFVHVQIPLEGKIINRDYGAAFDFKLPDSEVLKNLEGHVGDVKSLASSKAYISCKLDVYSDAIVLVKDNIKTKMPSDKGSSVAEDLIAGLGLNVTSYSEPKKAAKKVTGKVTPKKAAKPTAKKPATKKASVKGGKK